MIAPGGAYGSRQQMEQIQHGAPMVNQQPQASGPTPPSASDLIPFGAPTQSPDEPVTAGAPEGPGIGPVAAGIASDKAGTDAQLAGLLGSLEMIANLADSTPETRTYVRALKARLSGMGQ
jgi:hypothetical protein